MAEVAAGQSFLEGLQSGSNLAQQHKKQQWNEKVRDRQEKQWQQQDEERQRQQKLRAYKGMRHLIEGDPSAMEDPEVMSALQEEFDPVMGEGKTFAGFGPTPQEGMVTIETDVNEPKDGGEPYRAYKTENELDRGDPGYEEDPPKMIPLQRVIESTYKLGDGLSQAGEEETVRQIDADAKTAGDRAQAEDMEAESKNLPQSEGEGSGSGMSAERISVPVEGEGQGESAGDGTRSNNIMVPKVGAGGGGPSGGGELGQGGPMDYDPVKESDLEGGQAPQGQPSQGPSGIDGIDPKNMSKDMLDALIVANGGTPPEGEDAYETYRDEQGNLFKRNVNTGEPELVAGYDELNPEADDGSGRRFAPTDLEKLQGFYLAQNNNQDGYGKKKAENDARAHMALQDYNSLYEANMKVLRQQNESNFGDKEMSFEEMARRASEQADQQILNRGVTRAALERVRGSRNGGNSGQNPRGGGRQQGAGQKQDRKQGGGQKQSGQKGGGQSGSQGSGGAPSGVSNGKIQEDAILISSDIRSNDKTWSDLSKQEKEEKIKALRDKGYSKEDSREFTREIRRMEAAGE